MEPEKKADEEGKNTEVVHTEEHKEEIKSDEAPKDQKAEDKAVQVAKNDQKPQVKQEKKVQESPQTKPVVTESEKKPETQKKQAQKKPAPEKKQQKTKAPEPAPSKTETTTKKEETKGDEKPKTMKCVMLAGPRKSSVMEVPIPKPASGQVLVKVMAAPINPSDLALYDGHYSLQKKFPTAMGFEGSGIVVESGGGFMGWGLVGKKVAFGAEKEGQGTYSQYVIVKSEQCLPLTDDTSFEAGCMSVVNPLTALGMLDVLNQRKEKVVVFTAAASALGRMVNRIFPKEGIQVINVVRRVEQVELLKKEGAKYVLNSSQENFETELRVLAQKMGAKTCFECIGGDFTAIIIRNMPKNSIITVYGCLSQKGQLGNIEVMDLLFGNKTINSFMLTQWMKTKNQLTLLPVFYKVRSSINDGLKTVVAKKFKLEQIQEAIKFYLGNMSQGKVLIQPWSD